MTGLLTTAVGSLPKPDYLAKARSAFASGRIDGDELEKLTRQATTECIRMQEDVGLDILVHGEMERGDMVAYFAELLTESMAIGGLVRSYGNRYYHKPIITGELHWQGPMAVEMWRYAQSLTDKPVKGMLTGPYTMVEWSFDEHYPSRREAVLDMARVIRAEVEELVKAGAKYVQIDEPAIHTRPEEDFDLAVEAMQRLVDGIDCEFHTHICYGEVELIYPDMLRLPVKQIHLAFKNNNFDYLKLLENHPFDSDKVLGVGVTDVHIRELESVDEVKDGIKATLKLMPSERTWILPDCGLKTRTWDEAEAKLRVMVQATRQVKRELEID